METFQVTCTRCRQTRWVYMAEAPTKFVCQRCQAVLAGRNAVDPLPTVGQRERGRRLAARRTPTPAAIQPAQEPRSALPLATGS